MKLTRLRVYRQKALQEPPQAVLMKGQSLLNAIELGLISPYANVKERALHLAMDPATAGPRSTWAYSGVV